MSVWLSLVENYPLLQSSIFLRYRGERLLDESTWSLWLTSFEMAKKRAKDWTLLKELSASILLTSSPYDNGISPLKFLVIQGCLIAWWTEYLSVTLRAHNLWNND